MQGRDVTGWSVCLVCARAEFSLLLLLPSTQEVEARGSVQGHAQEQTVCVHPGLHSLYRVSREFTFELTVVSTLLSLPSDTQFENEAEVE